MLQAHWGFRPDRIRMLLDKDATRAVRLLRAEVLNAVADLDAAAREIALADAALEK